MLICNGGRISNGTSRRFSGIQTLRDRTATLRHNVRFMRSTTLLFVAGAKIIVVSATDIPPPYSCALPPSDSVLALTIDSFDTMLV